MQHVLFSVLSVLHELHCCWPVSLLQTDCTQWQTTVSMRWLLWCPNRHWTCTAVWPEQRIGRQLAACCVSRCGSAELWWRAVTYNKPLHATFCSSCSVIAFKSHWVATSWADWICCMSQLSCTISLVARHMDVCQFFKSWSRTEEFSVNHYQHHNIIQ